MGQPAGHTTLFVKLILIENWNEFRALWTTTDQKSFVNGARCSNNDKIVQIQM